jgi:NitT/TauT family transport system ATP-binding protein
VNAVAVQAAPPAPAAARPLVTLSGVRKEFSTGTLALAGLDLAIGRHEFVSLLGPSGCGKSTALRLIAGLGRPTGGRVEFAEPEGVGEVGFVFQEPTLLPWATVFDNVRLPLRLAGRGGAAARDEIMAVLATVGLDAFANAYPRELSGGMRMRVSIARGHRHPPARPAHGRALRRARRDHPLPAEQRPAAPVAARELDRRLRHPQRLRVGLPLAAHRRHGGAPGPVVADIPVPAPYPRDDAFRTSEAYNATAGWSRRSCTARWGSRRTDMATRADEALATATAGEPPGAWPRAWATASSGSPRRSWSAC